MVAIVLTIACGSDTVGNSGADGSSSSSSDTSSSSSDSSSDASSSSGATSIDASSDSSAGDGADTTGPGGGPQCLEPDPALSMSLAVSGGIEGTQSCVVRSIGQGSVTFDCEHEEIDFGEVTVLFLVQPEVQVALEVGAEVQLQIVVAQAIWEEPLLRRSVIVHDAQTQQLLLAAIDSNVLDWVPALAPFTFEQVEEACAYGPDENDCLQGERMIWEAGTDGDTTLVGDGTRTRVGDYAVHVQRAYNGTFLECVDVETSFYELLIAVATP